MAAYFVFHHRVHDWEKAHEYLSKVGETLAPYHHELLVSADHSEVIEGNTPLPRTVVIRATQNISQDFSICSARASKSWWLMAQVR